LFSSAATFRDPRYELSRFRARLWLCALFALGAFGLLAARFYFLQVLQHQHYETLAENNRISIVPVAPSRGLILDRNGNVLAHNFSAYTLEITPSKVENLDVTIDSLAQLVDIAPRDRKRFKRLLEESRRIESLPIKNKLTEEEVARFAVNRFRFPGVDINARLFRRYPQNSSASHVVGYIGRINDKDLERLEENELIANYRGSDHIGKTGVEESFESILHGTTGFEQVETDAGGRAVRSLSKQEPTAGNNVILGLDLRLQQMAERAFGQYRGSLVAIEPKSGDILAFVSQPGYDPNLFVDGIDQANWDEYNNSLDKPLTNRGLRGQYPPGSTIKPFMALAGLHYGKRSPSHSIGDPGFFMLPGSSHRYRCWKAGGHGSVDLRRSVIISCDTYYYGLAHELGIDRMAEFLARFGFGDRTGVDVIGESVGVLPSPAWKRKRFKQPWYPGETVIAGIGQGYTLVTPLQMAHAVSVLANHGISVKPHFVKSIQDSKSGRTTPVEMPAEAPFPFNPEHLTIVRDAMIGVTQPGGTAYRATQGAEYSIAGKTGTAQVVGIKQNEKYDENKVAERLRDHALFIAYAPADDPKIALAVIVENGGHGGSTAAPIARQVFDFYLLGKEPPAPITEEPEGEEHD
jgi:penicillin-binding protein 2